MSEDIQQPIGNVPGFARDAQNDGPEARATENSAALCRSAAPEGIDQSFYLRLMGQAGRPKFRGEIYDYARTIELGNGYEVPPTNLCRNCRAQGKSHCRHFEIDTARQLIGPFQALKDPNVPLVMLEKAAQTLGSLVWDLWVHYLLVHSEYMRIIIFLENDQKAALYCDSRLMPTLKGNPDISPFLPRGVDRHDDKKTDIILTNGKQIRVCGLNETNASSLTWQVVIIDESWQHGKDGLQQKAMDRNKQVHNKKTFIVGQCGKKDEDLDRVWQRLRHVPVSWACPGCGSRQGFGTRGPAVERPSDFKAVEVRMSEIGERSSMEEVPNGERDRAAGSILSQSELRLPIEPPKGGSWAGLKVVRGYDDLKSATEIASLARTAFLECYHCGMHLEDTPAVRRALMESYVQDWRAGGVLPGTEIGFWNPEVVSVTIPFRDTMKEYIVAKKAQTETGNLTALETFYSSRWATAWDVNLGKILRQRNIESYDVKLALHDAWRLCMIVDNQKDLVQQWVMVLAVKKNGAVRQLWRGALLGLAEVRKKQLEYGLDARGNAVLKDQFVFLDAQYMPEQICQHIVDHKYGHWATYDGERTWICWNLVQGSKFEYQTHAAEKDRTKKFIVGDPNWREYQVDGRYVEVLFYPFSATACGQRFELVRDGKGPECLFLPQQPGEPPDEHELSHHSQIHSNKLVASKSFVPRDAREKYVPVPASAPDHYFHMWRIFEAVKEIWGIDGLAANAEVGTRNPEQKGEDGRG